MDIEKKYDSLVYKIVRLLNVTIILRSLKLKQQYVFFLFSVQMYAFMFSSFVYSWLRKARACSLMMSSRLILWKEKFGPTLQERSLSSLNPLKQKSTKKLPFVRSLDEKSDFLYESLEMGKVQNFSFLLIPWILALSSLDLAIIMRLSWPIKVKLTLCTKFKPRNLHLGCHSLLIRVKHASYLRATRLFTSPSKAHAWEISMKFFILMWKDYQIHCRLSSGYCQNFGCIFFLSCTSWLWEYVYSLTRCVANLRNTL